MNDPLAVHQRIVDDFNAQLETAYKLSSPELSTRRRELLAKEGNTWLQPYIEFSPQYELASKLSEVTAAGVSPLLAQFMDSSPRFRGRSLFAHQQAALSAAAKPGRHVIVATGTGSGKTESFLLPIFNSILQEAQDWLRGSGALELGRRDENADWGWRAGRSDERQPAVRAIVLYPTNALVNDQLSRLRSYICDDGAVEWQRENLNGNFIHFGRYTSATWLAGLSSVNKVRDALSKVRTADDLYRRVLSQSSSAGVAGVRARRFISSGRLPRSGTPEMLLRWDMQAAPPDVLVTNYSMLGYMLLRPLEARIFNSTRDWLSEDRRRQLTLVLDEAHTYTGARGAEVAYLIMRLRERLQVEPRQVRVIATSATLGESESELAVAREFIGRLMSVPPADVDVVRPSLAAPQQRTPSAREAEICRDFFVARQRSEEDGLKFLETTVGNAGPAAVFGALKEWGVFGRCQAGANHAASLTAFGDTVWSGVDMSTTERHEATAGLLALGTYARPDEDAPPLLPTRLHMWFRQLPGLWACLEPECGGGGAVGSLRTAPEPWCDCGARVLELVSCRVCGLAFLSGYPDPVTGELWPSKVAESQREEDRGYFCVEPPSAEDEPVRWIDKATTLSCVDGEGRPVYEFVAAKRPGRQARRANVAWDRLPGACPRCDQRNSTRSAIEDHRGKGFGSLVQLVETSFRLQDSRGQSSLPETPTPARNPFGVAVSRPLPDDPTGLRKLLVFSDGRQLAARLAGELEFGHQRNAFRQLLVEVADRRPGQSLTLDSIRDEIFDAATARGIDLSFGEVANFWSMSESERKAQSAVHFDRLIRREMADREVALERLGLGRFHLAVREEVPPLGNLSAGDTLDLLDVVLGILARANCVLPSGNDYQSLEPYTSIWERGVVVAPDAGAPSSSLAARLEFVRWPSPEAFLATRSNRLVRALASLGVAAGTSGAALADELWSYFRDHLVAGGVLSGARWAQQGYQGLFGLSLNAFQLSIDRSGSVHVCETCGYASVASFRDVCTRCARTTARMLADDVVSLRGNSYRKNALLARTGGLDPFPLQVKEHSGQISAERGQDYERYFQDLFFDDTESPLKSRIDVLSVTTTMEMGIDIGELSAVALSNVPPSVSNYQQRAGRAGRRSDRVASVVALTRNRSHDNYFWDRPAEMLTGQVRTPQLSLESEAIAQRHFNAMVLSAFGEDLFRRGLGGIALFDVLGRSTDWLDGTPSLLDLLNDHVADSTASSAFVEQGQRAFPDRWRTEISRWLSELPTMVETALRATPGDLEVLPELIRRNVLPRFGFPVDVVTLDSGAPDWERSDDLQRDLQIAIAEYAPGAEVVVDGIVHESIGLADRWGSRADFSPSEDYALCRWCQSVTLAPHGAGATESQLTRCSCGSDDIRTLPAIRPLGFKSRRTPRRYRGGGLEWGGSAGEARLAAGTASGHFQQLSGVATSVASAARTDELHLVNFGPDPAKPGFEICTSCGLDLGQVPHGKCTGRAVRQALLYSFTTDVVLFTFDLPAQFKASWHEDSGRAMWRSVATAVLRAASPDLQIDPSEIKAGVRLWSPLDPRGLGEVFLYDDVPNGAGYSRQIHASLGRLLHAARALVRECECDSACYRCLLDYGNQFWHETLDRFSAADFLTAVLDGNAPTISDRRARLCATVLDRLLSGSSRTIDVDDFGRAGVMVEDGDPMFVAAISALVEPTADRTTLRGRPLRLKEFADYDILRHPLTIVRSLR